MIAIARPRWMDEREPAWWKRALLAPLVPLAWAYGLGAQAARRLRRPRRLACRVVSVGNLTVGGSGKTPAAAWLAARLRGRGHAVVVASRGWGRRARDPVTVVSDGKHVHAALRDAGDEALVLAAHARGVPVLVGRDRGVVGLRAIAGFGADVLLLDDGLQHHRLARDVEIVCFDGAGLGSGHVVPRGPLREPIGALAGADAVLVVDGPLPEADAARVRAAAPHAAWFAARRRAVSLRPLAGGPAEPAAVLRGRPVGLLAGIARPAGFRRTLEALGAEVAAERVFPDHHRYRPRDVADLPRGAREWITTEKDAAKILPRWAAPAAVRVLAIELEVEDGEAFVEFVERRLRGNGR